MFHCQLLFRIFKVSVKNQVGIIPGVRLRFDREIRFAPHQSVTSAVNVFLNEETWPNSKFDRFVIGIVARKFAFKWARISPVSGSLSSSWYRYRAGSFRRKFYLCTTNAYALHTIWNTFLLDIKSTCWHEHGATRSILPTWWQI